MPAFQFTYGSVGDIVSSIQLVINVVVFLRQHGRPSAECAETEKEVKSLGCDLNLAYFTLQRTPGSSLSFFVEQRLQDEIRQCRSMMAKFYAMTTDSKSFWQKFWWAASQKKRLEVFRAQVIERRMALGVVLNFINSGALLALQDRAKEAGDVYSQQLASCDAQLFNVRDYVGNGFDTLSQQLAIYQGQIMATIGHVPYGVSTAMFFVISPTGIPIPISFAFCTSYRALDKILKAYMCACPEAGGPYVQRGDYNIVSPEGHLIGPKILLKQ
ncbi:hypothetical protein C8R45DRAFT_184522 [Mycena sanguinolenta]|nr:hypothetical protein C8R45DRAFT_184522 [Mycena sanguinolenta]